jgi:hypothetical protein
MTRKLKYIRIRPSEEPILEFRGRSDSLYFPAAKNDPGDETSRKLLELIDEDVGRLDEALEVIEELANFVFRGKYDSYIDFTWRGLPIQLIIVPDASGKESFAIRTYLWANREYKLLPNKHILYESAIYVEIEPTRSNVAEATENLMRRFIEQLLEIFEDAEVVPKGRERLLRSLRGIITLYENEVKVWP